MQINKRAIKVSHLTFFPHTPALLPLHVHTIIFSMHVHVSELKATHIQSICVSIRTTYQCTLPLCVKLITVIRGQCTDCTLDVREAAGNNAPSVRTSCQECVPPTNPAGRGTRGESSHTDIEMDTGEVNNKDRGCF